VDRSILHVDVPAFPIAVERVIEPGLRDRPVVVAPPGGARATILAASPEAARSGVRAGMPVRSAVRHCPGLVLLPVNEPLYERAAAAIATLLHAYSPLVEPARPGQSYLDLTGTGRLFGHATDVAARIRREIAGRRRLPATVGVATNKLVSRVAARVIRPDGLCDVFPGGEAPFLEPLPVGFLPAAAGPAERARLGDLGIARVGDLLRLSPIQVRIAFGRNGGPLYRQAEGIDDSPVRPPERCLAVTEQETLVEDSNARAILRLALWRLCERAGARLRRLGATPGHLRLAVRYSDGVTAAGRTPLPVPTSAELPLFAAAGALLDRVVSRRVRVRAVSLDCLDFARGPRQLVLFDPQDCDAAGAGRPAADGPAQAGGRRIGAAETLAGAIDRIRRRFGTESIVWGRLAPPRSGPASRREIER
jgi:DNA polymerase-4